MGGGGKICTVGLLRWVMPRLKNKFSIAPHSCQSDGDFWLCVGDRAGQGLCFMGSRVKVCIPETCEYTDVTHSHCYGHKNTCIFLILPL